MLCLIGDVDCHFTSSRVTYKDSTNQAVVDRLIREVKALNPEFLTQHIKGIITCILAMYRRTCYA